MKVKYTGSTEEQRRWGAPYGDWDLLSEDVIYAVSAIEEHTWHTHYYIEGIPGEGFNSVCFKEVMP